MGVRPAVSESGHSGRWFYLRMGSWSRVICSISVSAPSSRPYMISARPSATPRMICARPRRSTPPRQRFPHMQTYPGVN